VPGEYQVAYDFLTPALGWAVITDQLKGERTWVFKTTDGAHHWLRTFEGALAPPGARIHFVDRIHGYISVLFDHVIAFQTSDGGTHWMSITFPAPPLALTYADPTHAWCVSFSTTAPLDLYASSDGGTTWTRKTFPGPAIDGYGKGGESTLAFRRDGEGWLGAMGDTPYAFVTNDGGGTWEPAPVAPATSPPLTKGGQVVGPAYAVRVELLPGEGTLAIVLNETTSFESGYTSFDGGSTWSLLSGPPSPAVWDDVSFLNRQEWWAFRFGFLFKTFDAGRNWRETHVAPLIESWSYSPAYVLDQKHAWSFMTHTGGGEAGTALSMTSDGGLSWHTVNVPQPG